MSTRKQFHHRLLAIIILLMTACTHQPITPTTAAKSDNPQLARVKTIMMNAKYTQAVPLLQRLLKQSPQNPVYLTNLAIAYRQLQQDDKAAESLQQALDIQPHPAAADNLSGILHRQGGKFKQAKAAYESALATNPDYALAHLNLGILYDIYLQKLPQAEKHYQRYQAITGNSDKQVSGWLIDLQRRRGN